MKKALSAKSVTVSQIKPKPVLGAKATQSQAPQVQQAKHNEVEVRRTNAVRMCDSHAAQRQLTGNANDAQDVEHAYGGLSSPTRDARYFASLRDEMIHDMVNSKTRSLIDDYDAAEPFDAWKDGDEHALLTSDAVPSAWWSQATDKNDPLWHDDDETNAAPLLDDVPPPDDFADPAFDASDDVLDELLNVDVDAACT